MKLAIDIDEVLAEFLESLLTYHNGKHKTNWRKEDFHSYHFWKVWGGTIQQAIDKCSDFFETDNFTNLEPVKGSIESIKELSKQQDLYDVTSRPYKIENKTRVWLNKHFGDVFQEVHFTNGYVGTDVPSRTKLEICKEIGTEILIEDSIDYAKQCCNEIKVILINKPWNQENFEHENLIRVDSWDQVLDEINNLKLLNIN